MELGQPDNETSIPGRSTASMATLLVILGVLAVLLVIFAVSGSRGEEEQSPPGGTPPSSSTTAPTGESGNTNAKRAPVRIPAEPPAVFWWEEGFSSPF